MIPAPLVTTFRDNATAHWLCHAACSVLATAAVLVAGTAGGPEAVAVDGSREIVAAPLAVAPPAGEEFVTGENARFGAAMLIEDGLARFADVAAYSATLTKREAIRGSLRPPETVTLKLRHSPFGVYMKWLEGRAGQELLYVDGEHGGQMLVRPGGWRGRLLGTLKLDPTGDLAMEGSRHSVLETGLRGMAERTLAALSDDAGGAKRYTLRTAAADGRDAYRLTIEADHPAPGVAFRRSDIVIDAELLLPVAVANYGWPEAEIADPDSLSAATLVEEYRYADVDAETPVSLAAFEATNPDYRLSRR